MQVRWLRASCMLSGFENVEIATTAPIPLSISVDVANAARDWRHWLRGKSELKSLQFIQLLASVWIGCAYTVRCSEVITAWPQCVVLWYKMLTSSANHYLRPEYLSPIQGNNIEVIYRFVKYIYISIELFCTDVFCQLVWPVLYPHG